jgi:CHAT domain-containing protein
LRDARKTVETFKAAELRDYFRDDCVDAALKKDVEVDVVEPKALIIHPIVLPDRLELLMSQGGKLKNITVNVSAEKLTQEVNQLRFYLRKRQTDEYLEHAKIVYDWVVRPLEDEIKGRSIDTLVFVPDGALRTVPMAALHDGKQFLIQKYPVAVTPGLDLSDPKPLRREKVNVFAAGLSEAVQGFDALPNVPRELASIQRIYGGAPLVDKDYVMPRVEKELKDNRFNVVHIASHGVFSGDIDKTYLLTFDDKLTKERLDKYIGMFRFRDDPLELLTLSACETAEGDERAALGLAGIAVKAGARSALATLWNINDQATSILIEEFYRQLKDPGVSRAVALQRAQLKVLADPTLLEGHIYVHPTLWSPFLLINNWL